jgi:hypothetical protein
MTLTIDDIQKLVDVIDKKLDEKLDQKLDAKLQEYTRHLATKKDLNELRNKLEIKLEKLETKVDNLEENTVKNDDIAELFEGFEERIKDQILPLIKENKVNIEILKEQIKVG